MAYTLTPQHVDKLHRILDDLLVQSEAEGCLVCDQAGHVLDHAGLATQSPQLLSALGAGVFAATGELARLLGEGEFSIVLHEGNRKSILMCAVSEEALITVIFSDSASVGIVKLYAPTAAASVRGVLEEAREAGIYAESETAAFVLSDSDAVFKLAEPAAVPS